jgi:hypothetical protein
LQDYSAEFLPLIVMPTSLKIVGEGKLESYAAYFNFAPFSIGERVVVFQITPFSEMDLHAYKFVYDSLSEVSTVGIIHNHLHRILPPPVNTLCVFPLGKDGSYPCGLADYVKPGTLNLQFVF